MSGSPGQPLAATDHPVGWQEMLDAERAARFDAAHDRLKSTTEEPHVTETGSAKRTKDPSYVVFREEGEAWVLVTSTPVKASSRKAAIIAAAPGEGGAFFAVPAEQFRPLTRTVRQTTVDEFK